MAGRQARKTGPVTKKRFKQKGMVRVCLVYCGDRGHQSRVSFQGLGGR